ncbi:DMT family transporter [Synoicihabitans lomoniglobus]|uniref:EamA family transporter n=1 Tax=Synoicihabitans lomoniglobus TaxID=2909285 RepID=A0AAF0CNE6_9BACT|nr:EamA family transporter [Opitutaceae bacterium LMO-M01]WED64340.1 EamA family transporter [Opitutaceae bacterium LMO-M01]
MPFPDPPVRRRAILMLLLATTFWGLSFPLMKGAGQLAERGAPDASTWFYTTMMVMPRFVLAALVLAVALGRTLRGITRLEWKQGLMMGLFASAGMLFQADGLQFTAASTSAFLSQFYAILIPMWIAVRSWRNPGARVWLCTMLVLAGVAVLGQFDWHALRLGRGEAETLLASVFFMGQILTLERAEFAFNRVLPLTFVMFLVEGVVFGALAVGTAPSAAALIAPLSSLPWWGFTLALTVFCTLGAFLLMNKWQPRITSTEAGLLYCAEPVFSSSASLVLPGLFSVWAGINYANESLSGNLLIGGGLILIANVLLQMRPASSA